MMNDPKILQVISMAMGRSLDGRMEGECVSLVASVDGVEMHFLIAHKDWQRIVENADWWRDKLPPTEREEETDEIDRGRHAG